MAGWTELGIEVEHHPDRRAVVRLRGDIDIDSAVRLRATLDDLVAAGHTEIEVDLSGVDFLDSTGIGVFIRTARRVRGEGRVVLLNPSDAPRQAIEAMGLDNLLG